MAYDLSMASPAKYGQQRYDAFGRAIDTYGLDGTLTLRTKNHALSADAWDAEDMGPGPLQGTYASEKRDGHGRVIQTTERIRVGATIEQRQVETTYLQSGESIAITRRRGQDAVTRTMQYDTLGHMTGNQELNTSYAGQYWRCVYSDAGDLVGTSDARGCGVNYAYDAGGRLISGDYSPCEQHHAEYTTTPEVEYHYDYAAALGPCLGTQAFTLGKLIWVTDRAATTATRYDARGRVVQAARQVKGPDESSCAVHGSSRQPHPASAPPSCQVLRRALVGIALAPARGARRARAPIAALTVRAFTRAGFR